MLNQAEKYIVKEESTLLDFLAAQYPQSSKTSLKKMISHGSIGVNGTTIKNPAAVLHHDDEVTYRRHSVVVRAHAPFRIIYEDPQLIVIDKPAGMLTYGEKGLSGSSAYKELKEYLSSASKSRSELFVVHRLDREVSGLLLFAKTEAAQDKLKENWHDFTKKYRALVEGILENASGVARSWLSDGPEFKVHSGREREGAKYAETSWEVMKIFEKHTLIELHLVTGRKNQIRVQLSDIGHPVTGDRKYGADAKWERRIRLHGCFLRIRHPKTDEWMEFHSDLPRGFLVLKPEHEKYK
ncbi:MAG: RluA family pseudouridine synthase [Bacteroidetes bacterium]|nr:RluA family pseudouridine synthase [Bacteroidota bacterium]